MSSSYFTALPDRGVIGVSGPDSRTFLQGLISNDITQVTPDRSIYSALLTPQGKYLFDFFISQSGDQLLIDCEKDRLSDLSKRLRIYKLRADATITDLSDGFSVAALWGTDIAKQAQLEDRAGAARDLNQGSISVDPRLNKAGLRLIVEKQMLESLVSSFAAETATPTDYDLHRLKLGLPASSRDLIVDKSILLESGIDDLNGINWDKGCYMGQELTARTKYRGLIKKRLVSVTFEGAAPEPGVAIMNGDKVAGEMRSSNGSYGLALLRLEHLDDPSTTLTTADTTFRVSKPDWARF